MCVERPVSRPPPLGDQPPVPRPQRRWPILNPRTPLGVPGGLLKGENHPPVGCCKTEPRRHRSLPRRYAMHMILPDDIRVRIDAGLSLESQEPPTAQPQKPNVAHLDIPRHFPSDASNALRSSVRFILPPPQYQEHHLLFSQPCPERDAPLRLLRLRARPLCTCRVLHAGRTQRV